MLLLTITCCSDEKKRQHVIPLILNIFTEEKLQEILLFNIHLDEVVLNFIRNAHTAMREPSSSINWSQSYFDNVYNMPIIPLEQLPSHLISLMKTSTNHSELSAKNVQDKIVIHIGKSLEYASKLNNYAQELLQIKEVLLKYGWLNEFDGFTVPLTEEGFQALFSAMNDIFHKKAEGQYEPPTEIPDLLSVNMTITHKTDIPCTYQSDISTGISKNDNRILYTYNNWLVDRPPPAATQFVQ
ncbi:hypothetical protein I4U23_027099 [Adineta vaga]|nr:hypothetical protein I4U23_027099 [Adineta vaga]